MNDVQEMVQQKSEQNMPMTITGGRNSLTNILQGAEETMA